MSSGIYEILNTVNGKRYVGSAVSIAARFRVHRHQLRRGKHHSAKLQRSWDKHGESAFEFRPILTCDPENLLLYEQILIDGFSPELNILKIAGSALGHKWSEESRAKILGRPATFAGRTHTPETIAAMAAAQRGVPSPTKGKKRAPEAVAASASAHLGMKRSAETKAKISAKAIGRRWSDGAKAKLSKTMAGCKLQPEHAAKLIGNQHAKGYQHTDEWKAAASARQTGKKRTAFTDQHRAAIAAARLGKKATPQARANQAAAQLGKKRGPYRKRDVDPDGSLS